MRFIVRSRINPNAVVLQLLNRLYNYYNRGVIKRQAFFNQKQTPCLFFKKVGKNLILRSQGYALPSLGRVRLRKHRTVMFSSLRMTQ